MALVSVAGVTITGVISVLPAVEINNQDLFTAENADERMKVLETTGIRKRREVTPGQTSLDLAKIAVDNLFAELDWAKEELGLIIFVTQTPDFPFPGNAVQLQAYLNLPKSVLAFDLNLGCSGFIYGLWQITQLLNSLSAKKALLIVGDSTSTQYSKDNATVNLLFGDALSVIALEKDPQAEPMVFDLGTDGRGAPYLMQPNGGARAPGLNPALTIDGMQVFVFGLREIPSSIDVCLAQKEWAIEDLDFCIMNQANEMLLKRLGKKMNFTAAQNIIAMGEVGNTSSASLPLAMSLKLAEPLLAKKNKLLLSGFGVGWSWGTLAYEQPPLKLCKLLDLKQL